MNLFEIITQSDLNDVIDLLLNNYHREIDLNIDDSSNDYCTLDFDLSEGVDAGNEVIFNEGDELHISIADKRLALMGYTIHFFYYQLDKGDYTGDKSYDDLQTFDVKLDEDTVSIPFTDNQVYLQKNFTLILLKDIGYRLLLNASSTFVYHGDNVVLTADFTLGSVPVEEASVEFYNGETLIDTVVTDEDGLAVLTVSDLPIGSYNFSCVCDGTYSDTLQVTVVNDNVIELEFNKKRFSTYSSTPFTFNGRVFVDWGDNTGLKEYTNGILKHNYSSFGEHTIRIYGDITSIESSCFRDVEELTSVSIPDSVTSIGNSCFNGCTGLTSVSLSDSVTSLGNYCFNKCTALTSITLPDSVTIVGGSCFRGCTGLTSVSIPDSVTSLGGLCFSSCSSLTSLTIPNTITSIGDNCFQICRNLTNIILNWNISNEILTYNDNWIAASPAVKFSIPSTTTSLYTAKSYPSNLLVERT